MDKNNSMEGRYYKNLTRSITEETPRIPQQHFKWGGTQINRSNSSVCLNSVPQRSTTKIDPRIYADVCSKGLASRIVQYHENGARLRRSMSVNNLGSSVVGQFQATRFNKNPLPAFKATKQNIPVTRIQPHQKSLFYGNTLSSLLRSSSVTGLQKTDEEISRENRPIIHPPPNGNELEPTRSVLEVLKEISRKRINHEDSSPPNESTKKYCNRETNDTVDTYQSNNKRQRNQVTNTTSMQAISNCTINVSPEQVAKKRICSYNNDIISSLSSSAFHANKRKFYLEQRQANRSLNLSGEEDETRKTKVLCQRQNMQPSKTFDTLTSTAVIPSPFIQNNLTASASENCDIPPRRTASAPANAIATPPTSAKPKLTLFNKNYDDCKERVDDRSSDLISPEQCESAGIQFVKPKKSSSIQYTKNPLIERTQKSKLALMLCALRGELYQGDEVDTAEKEDKVDFRQLQKPSDMGKQLQNDCPTVESTPQKIDTLSSEASQNEENGEIRQLQKTNEIEIQLQTESTVKESTSTKSNEQMISKSAVERIVPQEVSVTTDAPTSTANAPPTTTSNVGGFKFVSPTETMNTPSTTNPLKTASPLVGLKLSPPSISPKPLFVPGNLSAIPLESSTNTTTSGNSVPKLSGFSFGNSQSVEINSQIPNTKQLTQMPMVGSSPILNVNTTPATSIPSVPASFGSLSESSSTKPFTFGITTCTAPSNVSSTTMNSFSGICTATNTSKSFSFGNANTVATTLQNAFGASIQKPIESSKQFSFTAKSSPETTITESSTSKNNFTFGTSLGTETAKATIPAFAFGTSTDGKNISSTNAFTFTTETGTPPTKPSVASSSFFVGSDAFKSGSQSNNDLNSKLPPTFGSITTRPTTDSDAAAFNFGGANAATKHIANTTTTTSVPSPFADKPKTVGGFSFGASPSFSSLAAKTDVNSFSVTSAPTNSNPFGITTRTTNSDLQQSFGTAAATDPTKSLFGGSATSNNNNNNKTTFGTLTSDTNSNQAKTFSFGNTTATSNNSFSNHSSTFGSLANTANSDKGKTFTFGGPAVPAFNNNNNNNHTTTFGTLANTEQAKTFTLGGTAASSNNKSNITFGALGNAANSDGSKTFTFGTNSSVVTPMTNIFGTSQPTATAPDFSFGSVSNAALNTPITTSSATAPTNTFTFGNKNNSVAPFSFGATTSKTFSFGSEVTNNNTNAPQVETVFGGGASTAAFNFPKNGNNVTTPVQNGNLFAAQPSASDRPIRRATRRLQK